VRVGVTHGAGLPGVRPEFVGRETGQAWRLLIDFDGSDPEY
jgi:hypothetical protein